MEFTESALPEPNDAERERAESVAAVLRDRMAASGGAIPFDRFMRTALYEPGLGYYVGGRERLGRGGDFVTAPELTPFFGYTVAGQVVDLLARCGGGDVLEAGAGSGALATQLLAELERLGNLPERYRILEVSPDLKERQRRTLERTLPHLMDRVEWLEDFPAEAWRGVVVANELLDSLPVHRVRITEEGLKELHVAPNDSGGFQWREGPVSDPRIADAIGSLDGLPAGMETEVNLEAPAWTVQAAESLERGGVLLIDYGHPAAELYSPGRARGTLMCHFRHRAHDDPFYLPGVQDITAHVDFSAVAGASAGAGLELGGFATQAQFLINLGLTHRVESYLGAGGVSDEEQLQLATALKQLTLPQGMGESFKALLLVRGVEGPFPGFRQGDRAGEL
ncbi:class I SAM-dependent methyltransferase [Thiohalorhabdus sp. Cl-TMA]|uniref:Class I SAM-dependent methyltransferase n=1 Tax=Thiohalorhabdus methylotrophus TaxID=3242694 RepID=A0ABV4TQY8_9GAMM